MITGTRKTGGGHKSAFFCILLFLLILIYPKNCVLVEYLEEEKPVLALSLGKDEVLQYHSIHSVTGTPLEELFTVSDKELKLKEVRYTDQGGAGLPEYGYGEEEFRNMGDYFSISNFDRSFKEIIYTIQQPYENRIIIRNTTYELTELIPHNKRARLSVVSVPNIYRWFLQGKLFISNTIK